MSKHVHWVGNNILLSAAYCKRRFLAFMVYLFQSLALVSWSLWQRTNEPGGKEGNTLPHSIITRLFLSRLVLVFQWSNGREETTGETSILLSLTEHSGHSGQWLSLICSSPPLVPAYIFRNHVLSLRFHHGPPVARTYFYVYPLFIN